MSVPIVLFRQGSTFRPSELVDNLILLDHSEFASRDPLDGLRIVPKRLNFFPQRSVGPLHAADIALQFLFLTLQLQKTQDPLLTEKEESNHGNNER